MRPTGGSALARPAPPSAVVLDGLVIPALAVGADGRIGYANSAAAVVLGVAPTDLVGRPVGDLGADEAGRGALKEVLGVALAARTWSGELVLGGSGGRAVTVETTWTAYDGALDGPLDGAFEGANDGADDVGADTVPDADVRGTTTDAAGAGDAGVLVLVEELPERTGSPGSLAGDGTAVLTTPRPGTRRLHRFAAVISELLVARSVQDVADAFTEHMMSAAGATVVTLSLLVDDQTLSLYAIRGGKPGAASRWATYPLASNTPAAEAVRSGEPIVLVGRDEISLRYPDLERASEGERSLVCLPLLVSGGRCVGVISLSFPGRWQVDDAEALFLRLLADTCALSLDRVQAQAEAADRESKLALLAETGARMSEDLDYEATLDAVAHAAIPWFADWCVIELQEDGRLRTLSVAHVHPEHDELIAELQRRFPSAPEDVGGTYTVLRTGRSSLVPEITDELLSLWARHPDQLDLTRRLELRSALSCALKVRDRAFGVITWVTGERGRRFSLDDQAFAEDLAQRAAIAIDNAQLHSQVREVAVQLQRAVLPERLPDLPGWTAAVCYSPSGRTDAGGDFYDAVGLDDGRVAIFVGDVMGRGVAAASVMAQMRSAIRTLVALDPAPAAVMAGMDRVFATLRLEQLVTMVYAVVDPGLDHVAVINAGHPSPLLVRADGQVEALAHPSTLLLGVGGGQRAVVSTDLLPGDALFLYTDGLVERRGGDDEALVRLRTAVARPVGSDTDRWLADLVDEIRDPTRDDDVAALLVRREV